MYLSHLTRRARRRKIIAAVAAGEKPRQVAERFGVSRGTVYLAVAKGTKR